VTKQVYSRPISVPLNKGKGSMRIITFMDLGKGMLYEATKHGRLWNIAKINIHERIDSETLAGSMLAEGLTLDEAVSMLLDIAKEQQRICDGCDTPYSQCGPKLWAQQKKCCPDCSHVPEVETNMVPCPQCNGGADLVGNDGPCVCGRRGYLESYTANTGVVGHDPKE